MKVMSGLICELIKRHDLFVKNKKSLMEILQYIPNDTAYFWTDLLLKLANVF